MPKGENQFTTPWTVKECKVLWDYPTLTYKQLSEMLPGRTPAACKQMANSVGAFRSHRGRPLVHGEKVLTVFDKYEDRVILREGTMKDIAFLLGIKTQEVSRLYTRCRKGLNTRRYVITDYKDDKWRTETK